MNEPTVYVVDDDDHARASVVALVQSMGVEAQAFPSGEDFLEGFVPGSSGCVVTDVRMLGMSGMELQETLIQRNITLPVVILTAFARTPMTVKAIKSGAITVLEKPYDDDDLWDAIRKGLAMNAGLRVEKERSDEIQSRLASLSAAERDVMRLMVRGKANKEIAQNLGVSVRTIEGRRREVFVKMRADSIAELVRVVLDANIE